MSGAESAYAAMVSGLGGLSERFKAYAQNIAAAAVPSSKERDAFMASLQTQSTGSVYTPSGITAKPVVYNDVAGGPAPSSTTTFLAVAGSGYFVTTNSAVDNPPGTYGFTRLGTFDFDKDGNLVNHVGQYLKAFPVSSTGVPINPDVSTLTYLRSINSSNLVGAPQATTTLKLPANLPATTPVGGPAITFPTTVYDSLGLVHSINIVCTKVAQTNGVSQTWNVQVQTTEPGVTVTGIYNNPAATAMPVVFGTTGVPLSINGASAAPPANNAPPLVINWADAAASSNIAIDFGSIGEADGLTSIGNTFYQGQETKDGVSLGSLTGIQIGADGLVVASFNNGSQLTFAKIPLATFNNVNGLVEASGNVYTASLESGTYRLQFPGTGNAGTIVPSALEQSTIDTASVYTDMLVDEKRYIANVKGIQVVNTILDALASIIK